MVVYEYQTGPSVIDNTKF